MLPPKTVGVLLRDADQTFPLEQMGQLFERAGARMHLLDHEPPPDGLDLIVAMGGDGTVLRALDEFPGYPVLAINYGTVGFLTAGDRTDLEHVLQQVFAGDCIASERLILKCEHAGRTTHSINEVLIRSSLRMVQVDVFVNEAKIRTIRGDGVIVGTPTGSTGYLLSTGAPLVMPDVHCFILDGINEYNFSSRALILPPDSRIRLLVHKVQPGQEVRLVVDGQEAELLEEGAELVLTRSSRTARLIFLEPNYFFHNLTSRLRWL